MALHVRGAVLPEGEVRDLWLVGDRVDRDAGVLALRDAGSPFPYPELDDEPEIPRLVTAQAKAGAGWVKLVDDPGRAHQSEVSGLAALVGRKVVS